MNLPIAILFLSTGVAGLTQIVKFFAELGPAKWKDYVPQIVAALIASFLSLANQAHLPIGVGAILSLVINQLGAPLTAVLLSAGSYFLHDVAGVAQSLKTLLQSQLPPARK